MTRAPFACYPLVGQMPRDGGRDPRTALSQAAYMHRTQIRWDGRRHGYTALKDDLVFSPPILPEGAPAWTAKLEERWGRLDDAAEQCFTELRGFHICADLPREMPDGVWLDAMADMIRLVAPKGTDLVADLCGHRPKGKPAHAHILMSARVLEADGYGRLIQGIDLIIEDLHDLYCEWACLDRDTSGQDCTVIQDYVNKSFSRSAPKGHRFGF